jgi:hypothetical protein
VLVPPSTTLSPAAGTPEGDQLFDRLQFPLFGLEVLAVPFQVLVVIGGASLGMCAIVLKFLNYSIQHYMLF